MIDWKNCSARIPEHTSEVGKSAPKNTVRPVQKSAHASLTPGSGIHEKHLADRLGNTRSRRDEANVQTQELRMTSKAAVKELALEFINGEAKCPHRQMVYIRSGLAVPLRKMQSDERRAETQTHGDENQRSSKDENGLPCLHEQCEISSD